VKKKTSTLTMRKNNLSLADYLFFNKKRTKSSHQNRFQYAFVYIPVSCVKTPLDVTVTQQELFTQPL